MKKDTGKAKNETVGVCVRCGKAIQFDEAIIIDEKLYCKECAEKIKMDEEQSKRLHKSAKNRMLGGVCGGLGEYFNIDPTIVRVVFAILLFVPNLRFWFMPLIYLLLWIIMPEVE